MSAGVVGILLGLTTSSGLVLVLRYAPPFRPVATYPCTVGNCVPPVQSTIIALSFRFSLPPVIP